MANSLNATVAELRFKAGEKSATHHHLHEEYNYVVKGEFDCLSGDATVRLCPGDAVSVGPNVDHNLHCVSETDGVIVSFWTPSRKDLIEKLKG